MRALVEAYSIVVGQTSGKSASDVVHADTVSRPEPDCY